MKKVDAISYVLLATSMIFMVVFVVYKIVSNGNESSVVSYVSMKRSNAKTMDYRIGGSVFHVVHGVAKNVLPNGIQQTIKIFGEPVYGDLDNNRSKKDVAVILSSTQENKTRYYSAFVVASGTSYKATDALFLGSEIDMRTVEIQNGDALYSYKEIVEVQATTSTSTLKSVLIHYNPNTQELKEISKDLHGGADTDATHLHTKH